MEFIMSQFPVWVVASGFAILGAVWGSFVAALCHRWPIGESLASGRSRCDHCTATLRPIELVPILSYLLQRGRCRRCGASIARSNLWTEIICAALGLSCALLFSGWAAVGAAMLCWLLVPLILLDWQHFWLPDRLTLILGLTGIAMGGLIFEELTIWDQLIGGVAGFGTLELIRQAYSRLREVEAMGGGDPKLFGAIGLWMGWQDLPILLLVASLIGLGHFAAMPSKWGDADKLHLPLGSYIGLGTILWLLVVGQTGGLRLLTFIDTTFPLP
jgi:leader peptidase (prepilin peptidase) / N-methyltransferase